MERIQQAPLLFDAVPQHPLAFVPAVAGVITWVCLIVAIVRWMRRPIVLLRGELGPRRGGAGGDAAAGGDVLVFARVPAACQGRPARQQV